MIIARLGTAFATGTLALALGLAPASAATLITRAFLANAKANVAFLGQSSRIARDHAKSADIVAFARGEAEEQAKTAVALNDVGSTNRQVAALDAQALDGQGLDGQQTGRSVAIAASGAAPDAANGRRALGAGDLATLQALSGRKFDDAYWVKQLDALSQLESDYRAYIKNGDDSALVAMANGELPKVMRHLWQLTKI